MIMFAARENGEIMVEKGNGYYDLLGQQGLCKDSLKVGTWRVELEDGGVKKINYKMVLTF